MPARTGTWVPHQDPDYMGMYSQRLQCPEYAYDFDCLFPNNLEPTAEDAEILRQEYNQVLRYLNLSHRHGTMGQGGKECQACQKGGGLVLYNLKEGLRE